MLKPVNFALGMDPYLDVDTVNRSCAEMISSDKTGTIYLSTLFLILKKIHEI
jgi:hypothetical protein